MACKNCGQNSMTQRQPCKNCGNVGATTIPCNSNPILPVVTLPSPETASRRFIYLLPSEQYFALNYEGDGFNELKNEGAFMGNYYEVGDVLDFNDVVTPSKWKMNYKNNVVQNLIIDFDFTCTDLPLSFPMIFKFNCPSLLSELESLGYVFDETTVLYLVKEYSSTLVIKSLDSTTGNTVKEIKLASAPLLINGENVVFQIESIADFTSITSGSIRLIGQFDYQFVGKINVQG